MSHQTNTHLPLLLLYVGFAACAGPTEPATPAASDPISTEAAAVTSAAQRDYKTFLHRIPEGDEAAYGFENRAEFEHVQVGTPLRVHTIDVDRSGPSPTVSEAIRPLNEWRVPLIVDEEQRALLTIVKGEAGYTTTDFGASGLASALNALIAATPSTAGSAVYLLRIFDLRQDFLRISDAAGERFYPASPRAKAASTALPDLSASVPQGISTQLSYDRNTLRSFIQSRVKDGVR